MEMEENQLQITPATQFQVRLATKTDLQAVQNWLHLNIEQMSWYDMLREFKFSFGSKGSVVFDAQNHIALPQDPCRKVWVAMENNQLLGYACMTAHVCNEVKLLTFTTFGVLPESRGKGIGRAIVDAVVNYAVTRYFGMVFAYPTDGSEDFWFKMGFKYDGKRYFKQLPAHEEWLEAMRKHLIV